MVAMAKVGESDERGGGTGSLEELPLELRQNTIVLRGPAHPSSRKALVYLLGTAHVSQVSSIIINKKDLQVVRRVCASEDRGLFFYFVNSASLYFLS